MVINVKFRFGFKKNDELKSIKKSKPKQLVLFKKNENSFKI